MEDNFTRSFFDENSKRAKMGLAFQAKALEEFLASGAIAKSVPEWLKLLDPDLSDSQVWKLEKTWGDIVIKKKDGSRIFIECVTSSGETTPFPLSKSENFSGKNKWYLFGWEDERHFVPSTKWNAYADKIEERVQREKDTVVIVKRKQYASMRCGIKGLRKFCEETKII